MQSQMLLKLGQHVLLSSSNRKDSGLGNPWRNPLLQNLKVCTLLLSLIGQ